MAWTAPKRSPEVRPVTEPSVPDELIDLYIVPSHPGKGEIETRRAALAAFATRYGQTVREQTCREVEKRLQQMRADGDSDIRTAIQHVREIARGDQ